MNMIYKVQLRQTFVHHALSHALLSSLLIFPEINLFSGLVTGLRA